LWRLLLFVGLVVVVGAVVLGAFAYGGPTPLLRHVIAAGALVAVAGTIGVVGAQTLAVGISLSDSFGSSLGRSLIARGVPALILLASAVLMLRGPRPRELSVL